MNLARAKLAAFLNKKSWHTGGMPMQAEVWKREQEKAHEARKVEEMKREIAEERKMQELTDQAAEAGHVQKVERLEFMYKGGPGMGGPGMGVPSEDADAYLMGEKRFEAPGGDDALSRARDAPGSLLAAHPEAAKNETWNKLNSDPLLTMRVQEQEARRAITRNPAEAARAREIRKALERRRGEKKEKKRARKEEKKAAKRARKEKIRAEVRREVLGENAETRETRGRSRDVDLPGRKREGRRRSRGSSASSSDSDSDSGSDSRRRGGKRARPRSRSRSRDADHRPFRDEKRKNVNARRRREDGGRESPRRSPRSRSPPLAARDGASAQDGSKGYGLTYANARGERAAAVRRERRDEWRERVGEQREAEDEAARVERREKEARWAKNRRAKNGGARNTVGHETGKVSDSERAARLAAMSSDAAAHDASRVSRLREGAERDAARGEKSLGRLAASAPERHHSEAAPFLEKAQREAFGGGVGKDSLEDRIGTTKYYTRRGGGDDDDA